MTTRMVEQSKEPAVSQGPAILKDDFEAPLVWEYLELGIPSLISGKFLLREILNILDVDSHLHGIK